MGYVFANLHWFVLLLGGLVFFHELGHFLVAKACGIKVLRFSLGFGPRVVSFSRGDTEYQLSALPLGGYVKMLGEGPGVVIPPAELPRAFASRPLWQRSLVVLAGPAANFLLAWVVYVVMFCGQHTVGAARVGLVTPGGPAAQAGLRPGDRVVAVDGAAITRWDALREAIAGRPGGEVRLEVERPGGRQTLVLRPQGEVGRDALDQPRTQGRVGISLQYLRPVLAVVDPASPAARAGLATGDVVTRVGDAPVAAWHEVREQVARAPAGPLTLTVQRAGAARSVTVVPERGAAPAGVPADLGGSADAAGGYTGLVNADAVVAAVEPDTPAAAAGLLPGDRLLGIRLGDGPLRPIHVWALDLGTVALEGAESVVLVVQRGGGVSERRLVPAARHERDEMREEHTYYVIGVANDPEVLGTYTEVEQVGPIAAAVAAADQVGQDATLVARGLAKMVSGKIPLKTMGGPIMLFVIAEKSAKRGALAFFRTMAVISVNLGLLNLVPVPALDGGHLLFFAIEAALRRPPSARLRELAQSVGLALMLLMMVLVFKNDLVRFILP